MKNPTHAGAVNLMHFMSDADESNAVCGNAVIRGCTNNQYQAIIDRPGALEHITFTVFMTKFAINMFMTSVNV